MLIETDLSLEQMEKVVRQDQKCARKYLVVESIGGKDKLQGRLAPAGRGEGQ